MINENKSSCYPETQIYKQEIYSLASCNSNTEKTNDMADKNDQTEKPASKSDNTPKVT